MRGRRLLSRLGLMRSSSSITTDAQRTDSYTQCSCCNRQTKAAVFFLSLLSWLFLPSFNFYTYGLFLFSCNPHKIQYKFILSPNTPLLFNVSFISACWLICGTLMVDLIFWKLPEKVSAYKSYWLLDFYCLFFFFMSRLAKDDGRKKSEFTTLLWELSIYYYCLLRSDIFHIFAVHYQLPHVLGNKRKTCCLVDNWTFSFSDWFDQRAGKTKSCHSARFLLY